MLLKIESLQARYGAIRALKGVDLEVEQGEIITLIGSNGAGKTTTLSAIVGLLRAEPGSKIVYDGEDITGADSDEIVRRGICLVPEGREVFPGLSVEANLRLGAYIEKDKKAIDTAYERVYDLFPRLAERKRQMAGTLSGGEQQMLAIGRALMSKPRLLLMDEPSLGLAPNIVQNIFRLIRQINEDGTTIMIVEQNAYMALQIANRAYIMETGKIRMQGDAKAMRNDDAVRKAYLGHH